MQPENQSPRRSPALWAVVTNDLCIRRYRAHPNDVTPVYIWPSARENLSSEACEQ